MINPFSALNPYNWFKNDEEKNNKTRRDVRRPNPLNREFDQVANRALTTGLYHNTYPGLKLAGALAYNPIAIPVAFMGLPVPVSENERQQEVLENLVLIKKQQIKQIHTEANREGTIWIWPWYDSEDRELKWELIPDDSVTRILLDIRTMKIVKIYVEEEITISSGDTSSATIIKKRIFTKNTIETSYSDINEKEITQNVPGIFPVCFANNIDSGEIRGHSDYERILPDLKAYADLYQSMLTDLAKYRAKMIQDVTDLDKWLESNGYDDINEIDITEIDLIFNLTGQNEKTTFAIPDRVSTAYTAALDVAFKKLVEGSGIPEIAWGLKTQGNMASVEENMEVLLRYVEDKQTQYTEPWKILFAASLRLLNIVSMSQDTVDIEVEWNDLDAVSDSVRAEIFKNFADAINKLVDKAALTKQQLYKIWDKWFPNATEETFEEFVEGLQDMARFRGYSQANYLDQLDAAGAGLDGDENVE